MCGVNYKAVKATIKIEDMPSLWLISAYRIQGHFKIKVANSCHCIKFEYLPQLYRIHYKMADEKLGYSDLFTVEGVK